MSPDKQHIARAFAFTGATLLIGVVVFFFTQGLIPFIELPDIAGTVFALGFFLIFLNLSFGMSRRFCSRTFEMERFPYILGGVLILPTLFLSFLTERLSGISSLAIFFSLIATASFIGVFFGIKSGRRRRDKLIREALETGRTEKKDI